MRQDMQAAVRRFLACVLLAGCTPCGAHAQTSNLQTILDRTSAQVSTFLEQFSDVKCTENVEQEKLGPKGKIELKQASAFDYLVILTNSGGDLTLDESRLPLHPDKAAKNNTPLLVSNGFATLFLIFHPYYSNDFKFTAAGEEVLNGRTLAKINFQHVRGERSVAALSLRGREYPMELSGTAWIDPQTGMIARIVADIGGTMEDLGMKTLHSEVDYAPVPFRGQKDVYWFPVQATIEVETPRQHWRNIHRFTDYKQFSVSTEEQVAKQ
jgi:hypothetical protein